MQEDPGGWGKDLFTCAAGCDSLEDVWPLAVLLVICLLVCCCCAKCMRGKDDGDGVGHKRKHMERFVDIEMEEGGSGTSPQHRIPGLTPSLIAGRAGQVPASSLTLTVTSA